MSPLRNLPPARRHPLPIRWLTGALFLLVGSLFLSSCDAPLQDERPVALDVLRTSSGFQLRLNASPGVKINARLKPRLELEDGENLAFDAGRITPDSEYFAEPPRAIVPASRTRVAGTLRVSICRVPASYCQTVTIPIDQALPRT